MPSNSEKPPVKLAAVPKSAAKPTAKPAAATAREKSAPKIAVVPDDDFGPETVADKVESLKLKQLLSAVVDKTSAKKKDAKEIVEAVLVEIAAALAKGHSLSLPPLGNLRVVKSQEKGGATTMVLRLRVGGAKGTGEDGVADTGDDS
jgi:hypothetical protein